MTNTPHTPGPWIVEPITLTVSAPNPKGNLYRVTVAYVPHDFPNKEANAQLIALAPKPLKRFRKAIVDVWGLKVLRELQVWAENLRR